MKWSCWKRGMGNEAIFYVWLNRVTKDDLFSLGWCLNSYDVKIKGLTKKEYDAPVCNYLPSELKRWFMPAIRRAYLIHFPIPELKESAEEKCDRVIKEFDYLPTIIMSRNGKIISGFTGRRKVRKHWYKIYIGECPVCGKNAGYRERVYGQRPFNPKKRYVYLPDTHTYDFCME